MSRKQKQRDKQQPPAQADPVPPIEKWSPRTRLVLSILAVVHLFAVFSAPWSLPQPSSELARAVDDGLSPWTHSLYMRHGYRFFAPDPGPSHLILYEVSLENGEVKRGKFPDQAEHRPRLLYHRFFMISEHFWGLGISQSRFNQQQADDLQRAQQHLRENGFVNQADWLGQNIPRDENNPPTDEEIELIVDDLKRQGKHHSAQAARLSLKDQQRGMRLANRHREVWLKGIANYLRRKHNGSTVRIWIQEHMIPEFNYILDGGKLDDPVNFGPRILVYSEDEEI